MAKEMENFKATVFHRPIPIIAQKVEDFSSANGEFEINDPPFEAQAILEHGLDQQRRIMWFFMVFLGDGWGGMGDEGPWNGKVRHVKVQKTIKEICWNV